MYCWILAISALIVCILIYFIIRKSVKTSKTERKPKRAKQIDVEAQAADLDLAFAQGAFIEVPPKGKKQKTRK